MINVLYIAQRWFRHDSDTSWLSDSYHDHYEDLNSTGLGEFKVFEYDYQISLGIDPDFSLIEFCKHNKFDVIFFPSYFEVFHKFKDSTWDYIKNTLNIPVVFVFVDVYPTDLPNRSKDDFSHTRHADLEIHFDTDLFIGKGLLDSPPKIFFPLHSSVFYDEELVRDIPIIFNGTSHVPDRQNLLNYLSNVGIPIVTRGGKIGSNNESISHYVLNYMRSKISIVSSHEFNNEHFVAHTGESMQCGCCTFINKSAIVRRYFIPDEHYVEYDGLYDLADKLIYYMDNEDEAEEIAKKGKENFKKYSSYNYFNNIFYALDKLHSNFVYKEKVID